MQFSTTAYTSRYTFAQFGLPLLNKLNTHQQKGTELFVNEEKDTVVNLQLDVANRSFIRVCLYYLILFAMHWDRVMFPL